MSPRRIKKKKKWTEEDSRKSRESAERIVRDTKIMEGYLMSLYGFTRDEAYGYWKLVFYEPALKLREGIRSIFKERSIGKKIGALERAVLKYKEWLDELDCDPLVQRVLGSNPLPEDVELAVEAAVENAEISREKFEEDLLWMVIDRITNDFFTKYDLFETIGTEPLMILVDQLKQIEAGVLRKNAGKLAEGYARDILAQAKRKVVHGAPLPEDKIGDAQVLLADPWILDDVVTEAGATLDDVIATATPNNFRVSDTVRFEDLTLIEGLSLISGIANSQDHDYMVRLNKALSVFPRGSREEPFLYIADDPDLLDDVSHLQAARTDKQAVADYATTGATIQLMGTSMRDVVHELLAVPRMRENGKFMVEHTAHVKDNEALGEMLRQNPLAHILANDYIVARQEGRQHAAEMVLAIGQEDLETGELRDVRKKLSTISEEEIEAILARDPDAYITKILRYRTPKKDPPPLKKSLWNEQMLREHPELEGVYSRLAGIGLQDRLRRIWFSGKVREFTADYNTSGAGMEAVLGTPSLFKAYMLEIGGRRLAERIEEAHRSGGEALKDLLLKDQVEQEETLVVEIEEQETIAAKRIVFWTGGYFPGQKERIEAAIPVPVKFYDDRSRRSDLASIREGDVVVYLRKLTSHGLFYLVKSKCNKRGIPFYSSRATDAGRILDDLPIIIAA